MALILLLAFFVVLGVAGVLGWFVDSRDTDYSLGRLLAPRPTPAGKRR
jgi:hypothetical protein